MRGIVESTRPRRCGFLAVALGASVALAAVGCSVQSTGGAVPRECNGFDAPLSQLTFHARKELLARIVTWKLDQEFPITVETTPTTLVLTGYTPSGAKAYTLERRGDDVEVTNQSEASPAIPPRNIMEDVLAMSIPSRCSAGKERISDFSVGKWAIRDICAGGRPTERFVGHPGVAAEIEITYAKNAILLKQNRCGYGARYLLQLTAPRRP